MKTEKSKFLAELQKSNKMLDKLAQNLIDIADGKKVKPLNQTKRG